MKDRTTKNYFTDGGDTLVIGGKLVVEPDATLEGLDGGASVAPATLDTPGVVKKMPYYKLGNVTTLIEVEAQLAAIERLLIDAGMMADE